MEFIDLTVKTNRVGTRNHLVVHWSCATDIDIGLCFCSVHKMAPFPYFLRSLVLVLLYYIVVSKAFGNKVTAVCRVQDFPLRDTDPIGGHRPLT